jgi:hypothetical protein
LETAHAQSLLHLAVAENNVQVRLRLLDCSTMLRLVWQLLGVLLESGGGILKYKLLEEDVNCETASVMAERLEHLECRERLAAKQQQITKPDESLKELVRPA